MVVFVDFNEILTFG